MTHNRKRFFLYLLPVIFFLLLILFFFQSLQKEDENILKIQQPITVGSDMPSIEYSNTDYNGTIYRGFTNTDLLKNELSIVNIWASWCTPCRAEHEVLMKIAELNIPIYGINYKDKIENAVKFLDELGNPFSGLGFDSDGISVIALGVYGIPETFIIDSQGVILKRHIGPLTLKELEQINSLLLDR